MGGRHSAPAALAPAGSVPAASTVSVPAVRVSAVASRLTRRSEFRPESVDFKIEFTLLCVPERRWPATAAALFTTTTGPPVFAQYSWWDTWHVAKVRSRDIDGSFSVVWEDGTLQIGTVHSRIRRPSAQVRVARGASLVGGAAARD